MHDPSSFTTFLVSAKKTTFTMKMLFDHLTKKGKVLSFAK